MAAVKTTKTKSSINKLKAGKKKPLNKWIIVGGIAAVAIIGAVVVRFSSASSYTFIHSAAKGQIFNGYKGSDGYIYSATNKARGTIVSKHESAKTSMVCAHVKAKADTPVVKIQYNTKSGSSRSGDLYGLKKGKTGNVCVSLGGPFYNTSSKEEGIVYLWGQTKNYGVDTIYGKK